MGWLPVVSTALRAYEADVVPMAPIAKLLDETAVVLLQHLANTPHLKDLWYEILWAWVVVAHPKSALRPFVRFMGIGEVDVTQPLNGVR